MSIKTVGALYSLVKCHIKRDLSVKKETSHKFLWSRGPKHLLDSCKKLEAHIRSNTTHYINKPDGAVPKTVISGKSSDISQFYKLEQFEYYVWDEMALLPEDIPKLGCYLGSSIDIGPAMTTKIASAPQINIKIID